MGWSGGEEAGRVPSRLPSGAGDKRTSVCWEMHTCNLRLLTCKNTPCTGAGDWALLPFPSLPFPVPLPFLFPFGPSCLPLPHVSFCHKQQSNLHCLGWARLSHRNTTVGGFLSFLSFLLPLQLSLSLGR